ncbi:MAG: hypothetical protein HY931_01985 [Candidatus Falkowbacteria bacterium]|nr:MAG: hypothetical protein HY931_01985 [Candidatus Falkowbacteria bacterium]
MKRIRLLLFLVLLAPIISFSQNMILPNISVPGGISTGVISGAILSENLIGPRKILFLGNQSVLQKEESGKKSLEFGVSVPNIDRLTTLYSGKIFSPGIIEPFVFENKTSEELSLMEITVFPKILEQPYTLFIDLAVQVSSKLVQDNQSDDAGIYTAKINIRLTKI